MKKIIAMLIVLVGVLAACTNQITTENSTGSAVLDRIYAKKILPMRLGKRSG